MAERYFAQPGSTGAQSHFSNVPAAEIQRSRFDRSHGVKTTFSEAALVPVFLDEVLPGDTFNLRSTCFSRLATPLKPFMDNLYLDLHFFFVPNRLVWDNWQKFCGERDDPSDDPSDYRVPQIKIQLNRDGVPSPWTSLASYFGVPYLETADDSHVVKINALPFRAYNLIWNEWYRDQNVQGSVVVDRDDADSNLLDGGTLLLRNKRHDYFTSCLPWPQKGDPVYIPIATSASVESNGAAPQFVAGGVTHTFQATNPGAKTVAYSGAADNTGATFTFGGETGLVVDLTSATAITINDLRTAFQVQRLLERDARGGTRYIEIILAHFGVRSDDARLQRPEYLGGGSTMLNVNPIAATFNSTETPQGDLAAYATAVLKGGFEKSFTEHGFVIGLVSVRSDLTYQQGLERFWSRKTRYEYYWPALAHLGEQAVLNKEIYCTGELTSTGQPVAADNGVFGYQERYAEYRYKPGRITGLFNSSYATSLDVWHLAQDFGSLPTLSGFFLYDAPAISRVVAVPSEPHFLGDFWFDLKCDRPMPVYSVPGLIDHF